MASDWPRTFLQPGCFCLAYKYTRIIKVATSQLLLQVYFKSRLSTDEGDREDEGAWMHKVALIRTLHIYVQNRVQNCLELRLNSNEINVLKSI